MKRKAAKRTERTTPGGSGLAEALQQLNKSANNAGEENDQLHATLADQVERLAFYGLDLGAIALLVDSDEALLDRAFTYPLEHGRARWRKFLMEKLAEKVDEGDWPALKFALKNSCGMADNPQQAALQHEKLVQLRKRAADGNGSVHQPPPPAEQVVSPEVQDRRQETVPDDVVLQSPRKVPPKTHDSSLDLTQTGGADAPNGIAG